MAVSKRARFIYRIENSAGRGAYNVSVNWNDEDNVYSGPRHPGPGTDTELGYWGLSDSHRWSFGFRSMSQLRFWFHRESMRKAMHDAGLRVTKWRVPAGMARVSDAQAIFRKDLSSLVETVDLV